MPEFVLTRRGLTIGRLTFDWEDEADQTTRNVRLEDFTDRAVERALADTFERNPNRLKVAGGRPAILTEFYEGLQAALYDVAHRGGAYQWTDPPDVPPRELDPLAAE